MAIEKSVLSGKYQKKEVLNAGFLITELSATDLVKILIEKGLIKEEDIVK